MKRILILLCLPMIGFGQNVNIPDTNFKAYLVGNTAINTNGDAEIQLSEAASFNGSIYCPSMNIYDLTGIEAFTALTYLKCGWNHITSIDISNNIHLNYFSIYNYPNATLTAIDVSNNPDLEFLNIGANQVSSLDLSNNIKLRSLIVAHNHLTSLTVSNMPDLESLLCQGSSWFNTSPGMQLNFLDVSNNPLLNNLHCGYNNLTTLNLTNNPLITWLTCEMNQLTSLDVSNLSVLTSVTCNDNQLTELNLANGNNINFVSNYPTNPSSNPAFDATNNPNLTCINVDDSSYCNANWIPALGFYIDAQHYFSTNCAISGCTDSLACNYDSLATIDDSSCVYPVIWQQSFSICDGDSIVIYDGNTLLTINVYDTTGNYIDTLIAGNGCDSIVYTNVSIIPPVIWQQSFSICDGDSIVVGSSVYDTAGAYMDTLSSANGCDSIVYTYLVVDQNTSSYDTLSINASIVWNGMTLTLSGDYSVTLTNSVGCDSIANLNLTITNPSGILNITNTEKTLLKVTDVLGRETPYKKRTPLFYIYDDGTVEKRIVIE